MKTEEKRGLSGTFFGVAGFIAGIFVLGPELAGTVGVSIEDMTAYQGGIWGLTVLFSTGASAIAGVSGISLLEKIRRTSPQP